MAILLRSTVVLILANVGTLAVVGCDARLVPVANDTPALAEAGTTGCDGSPAPALDATLPPQQGDASSEATAPKICDPQDQRVCEVATAAEGVSCPMTYEDARLVFSCGNLPTGTYWLVGACGDFLIGSVMSPGSRHDVQCLYDPGTHVLVGSNGYDDCGAFCGGVNHVHWGVDLSPCGFGPGTAQGSCNADAGADAGGD